MVQEQGEPQTRRPPAPVAATRRNATIGPMSVSDEGPIILHADQDHSGIRLVVLIALGVAFIGSFVLVQALLDAFAPDSLVDYSVFLSCIAAVPLSLLAIWAVENWLKRVWHSGLSFTLDDTGMTVRDTSGRYMSDRPAEERAASFVWSDTLTQTCWYFKLSGYSRGGRERRVPAKWLCLATELVQEDRRLNVFTFMPPEKAATWIDQPGYGFQRLNPAELYDKSVRSRIGPPTRPSSLPNHLLHSKDGRYWLAERRRWQYGVELSPNDFGTLLDTVGRAMRSQRAGSEVPGLPG